jgi:DNA-binding CsgD family transcriptional regulator
MTSHDAAYHDGLSLGEPVFTVTSPRQPRVQLRAGASGGDVDYAQFAFFGRRPPQHITGSRNWCSSHGHWNAPLGRQPGAATLGDLLGQEEPQVEHMPGRRALAAHWGELTRREQEILLMRRHGDMTQAQIGQQLDISQMHVSRLLARALGHPRPRLPGPPERASGTGPAAALGKDLTGAAGRRRGAPGIAAARLPVVAGLAALMPGLSDDDQA